MLVEVHVAGHKSVVGNGLFLGPKSPYFLLLDLQQIQEEQSLIVEILLNGEFSENDGCYSRGGQHCHLPMIIEWRKSLQFRDEVRILPLLKAIDELSQNSPLLCQDSIKRWQDILHKIPIPVEVDDNINEGINVGLWVILEQQFLIVLVALVEVNEVLNSLILETLLILVEVTEAQLHTVCHSHHLLLPLVETQ